MKKSEVISLAEVAVRFSQVYALKNIGYRWLRRVPKADLPKPRVVIENAGGNFSAYSPDVPGCVSTGATETEVRRNFADALEFHLEGMAEDGLELDFGARSLVRGNSLAVMQTVRRFNASNKNRPIHVYSATGYDGTPSKILVIRQSDVDRLKRYLSKPGTVASTKEARRTTFRIVEKIT